MEELFFKDGKNPNISKKKILFLYRWWFLAFSSIMKRGLWCFMLTINDDHSWYSCDNCFDKKMSQFSHGVLACQLHALERYLYFLMFFIIVYMLRINGIKIRPHFSYFSKHNNQPFYEYPFILARLKSHHQTLHRKLHAATPCFTLHPWPDLWTGLPLFLPTHYLVTQSDYATDRQYKSGHYQQTNQPPQCWDNLSQQEVWTETLVILQNLLHVHLYIIIVILHSIIFHN